MHWWWFDSTYPMSTGWWRWMPMTILAAGMLILISRATSMFGRAAAMSVSVLTGARATTMMFVTTPRARRGVMLRSTRAAVGLRTAWRWGMFVWTTAAWSAYNS